MQSCSLPHCILLFLTLKFTTVPTLATSVSVKLHQTATLPCKRDCPGLAKWTMNGDVLAQCDQTSCRSKEGYEMSHSQYLKGDFSLVIPEADYSKRNMYTCECNDRGIDDVHLTIESLSSSVGLNPGEALVMDLPIPDPVEVIYKPKGGSYGERICTVAEHTLQCKDENTRRASLSSTNIILRDVQQSDSGSYTIRDTENNEVIHTYTLSVTEVQKSSDGQQGSHMLLRLLAVLAVLAVFIGAGFFMKRGPKLLVHMKQQEPQLIHEDKKCPETVPQQLGENNQINQNVVKKKPRERTARRRHSFPGNLLKTTQTVTLNHEENTIQRKVVGTKPKEKRSLRDHTAPVNSPMNIQNSLLNLIEETVPLNVAETESIKSQQRACSEDNVREVTIQIDEMNSLIKRRPNLKQ